MENQTEIAERLRKEIGGGGPIPFDRFMEAALYTPELGYYTRPRDPFGKAGDFFTAEQIQPVFGLLVRRFIDGARKRFGAGEGFRVVELGPGRRELAEFLRDVPYTGVDIADELPPDVTGVVFANEFFDALPVRVAVRRGEAFRELLVGVRKGEFAWVEGPAAGGALGGYLERYHADAPEGSIVEVNLRALEWMRRLAGTVRKGFLTVIDYGYTRAEWIRHTAGTLMSYRRHQALEDVLSEPGQRDITAHVAWTPLRDAAKEAGWERERFETLSSFLVRCGERDAFEGIIGVEDGREALRRRLQLKTLLFGMGETFRVLTLEKGIDGDTQ